MMTQRSETCFTCRFARLVSRISAPPLVLLTAAAAICAAEQEKTCWRTLALYAVAAVAVPLAILVGLKCSGCVEDFDLTKRSERAIPLVAATLGSALGWACLAWYAPGSPLTTFTAVQAGMLGMLLVISFFWKISIHAAGVAALVAIADPRQLPVLAAVFGGLCLVGWARVTLGKHTIGQFIAGGSLSSVAFGFWKIL